jgi:hypothetical protein
VGYGISASAKEKLATPETIYKYLPRIARPEGWFLALDLFYRSVGVLLNTSTDKDYFLLAMACCLTASNMSFSKEGEKKCIMTTEFFKSQQLGRPFPDVMITGSEIIAMQYKLLIAVSYIVLRNPIYNACETPNQLANAYFDIVLNPKKYTRFTSNMLVDPVKLVQTDIDLRDLEVTDLIVMQ